MKKCSNCGQALPRGSKFCEYCGASLKKPKSSASKLPVVVLSVCVAIFAISTAVLGFLYANSIQTAVSSTEKVKKIEAEIESVRNSHEETILQLAEANNTIKKKNDEIEFLESERDSYEEKAYFLDDAIGLITDLGSGEYHTFDCLTFWRADTYWAHNIEYCNYLGYSPCSICH